MRKAALSSRKPSGWIELLSRAGRKTAFEVDLQYTAIAIDFFKKFHSVIVFLRIKTFFENPSGLPFPFHQ